MLNPATGRCSSSYVKVIVLPYTSVTWSTRQREATTLFVNPAYPSASQAPGGLGGAGYPFMAANCSESTLSPNSQRVPSLSTTSHHSPVVLFADGLPIS